MKKDLIIRIPREMVSGVWHLKPDKKRRCKMGEGQFVVVPEEGAATRLFRIGLRNGSSVWVIASEDGNAVIRLFGVKLEEDKAVVK